MLVSLRTTGAELSGGFDGFHGGSPARVVLG
jgi:hypothetical protein